MKLKGINNSSKRTKNNIKNTFAELLKDKGQINSITVKELCNRACITRGAFYSHYDSIYDVAQEIESEIQDIAFSNIKSVNSIEDIYTYIDDMFEYIKSNDELYRKLLQSDDPNHFLYRLTKKLYIIISKALNSNSKDIDIKINFFINGTVALLIKYYRDEIDYSLDTIRDYIKDTLNKVIL